LTLESHKLLSTFAFIFNLRRHNVATAAAADATAANTAAPLQSVAATEADVALVAAAAERAIVVSVGRCRLPVSKPVLKAHIVSALEAIM